MKGQRREIEHCNQQGANAKHYPIFHYIAECRLFQKLQAVASQTLSCTVPESLVENVLNQK